MGGLVELGRYPDAALAHIVKGRLEAAGVHAVCFDTGMNIAEGVPMLIGIRVMVLDEDLAEAREVLAEDVDVPESYPDLHDSPPSPVRGMILNTGLVLLVVTTLTVLLTALGN